MHCLLPITAMTLAVAVLATEFCSATDATSVVPTAPLEAIVFAPDASWRGKKCLRVASRNQDIVLVERAISTDAAPLKLNLFAGAGNWLARFTAGPSEGGSTSAPVRVETIHGEPLEPTAEVSSANPIGQSSGSPEVSAAESRPVVTWHGRDGSATSVVIAPTATIELIIPSERIALATDLRDMTGTLDSEESATDEDRQTLQFGLASIGPNPLRAATPVRFQLPSRGLVSARVYDVAGRHVKRIADGPFDAGVHQVELSPRDLHPGQYYLRLSFLPADGGAERQLTRSFVFVK